MLSFGSEDMSASPNEFTEMHTGETGKRKERQLRCGLLWDAVPLISVCLRGSIARQLLPVTSQHDRCTFAVIFAARAS